MSDKPLAERRSAKECFERAGQVRREGHGISLSFCYEVATEDSWILEQHFAAKDAQIAALEKEIQVVDKALGDWLKDYDNRRGAIMNLRQCQMTAGENVTALKVQVAALGVEVEKVQNHLNGVDAVMAGDRVVDINGEIRNQTWRIARLDALKVAANLDSLDLDGPFIWTCEAHPWLRWPHEECAGPGMPIGASLRCLEKAESEVERLTQAKKILE